jgi:hypothetical protein
LRDRLLGRGRVRNPNPAFWYAAGLRRRFDCLRAFAWGEADAEAVPPSCTPPVYATGSPRLDLTR